MSVTPGLMLLSLASLGAAAALVPSGAPPRDAGLSDELAALSRRVVFFGHQSVGANVLEGLARISAGAGRPARIVEVATAAGLAPGTWGHSAVGVNGDPRSKLDAFARALDAADRDPDVALVKLCYVDFDVGTDPAALLEGYRATLAGLRARHPGTAFVHVTAPLTAPETWPLALARRLLGRTPSAARNAVRERYNALLRETYAGREPLFDLARIESTCPDGSAARDAWLGVAVPALCPAYSADGGHLNAAGGERAARALVEAVAAALRPGRAAAAEARGWTR